MDAYKIDIDCELGETYCLICFDTVDPEIDTIAISGKCDHPDAMMHRKCLMIWLKVKAECPLCRIPLRREDLFSNDQERSSSTTMEITPLPTTDQFDEMYYNDLICYMGCIFFVIITLGVIYFTLVMSV